MRGLGCKVVSSLMIISVLFTMVPFSNKQVLSAKANAVVHETREVEDGETPGEVEPGDGEQVDDTTPGDDSTPGEEPGEERTPLERPKNFCAKRNGTEIVLSWTRVKEASGYEIYRHISGIDGYKLVHKASAKETSYEDKKLTRKRTYKYKIIAIAAEKELNSKASVLKNSIAVPILAPNSLKAKEEGFYLKLSWKGHKDDSQYEVYRSNKKNGVFKLVKKTKNLEFVDKSLKVSTVYYYKVKARNSKKSSLYRSDDSKILKTKSSHLDKKKPLIALTFDDGPSENTKIILKSLKKYHGKATFFVVGNRVHANRKALKAAFDAGCEIGNHSWNHANLGTSSASTIRSQLKRTDAAVKRVTGQKTTVIRPPYGSCSSTLASAATGPLIIWSIDTLDWKTRNADKVYNEVIGKVRDGDVVLMHDLYDSTAAAAKRIIKKLSEQGYQMVTVSELATCKGQKLNAGQKYFRMK